MEDLMKPRYKVSSEGYPFMSFNPNQILELHLEHKGRAYYIMTERFKMWHCEDFDKYPSIFRKLQWWEERNMEDMPEYVRMITDVPYYDIKKGEVQKLKRIYKRSISYWCADLEGYPMVSVAAIEPATKEQYELTKNGLLDGK